MWDRSPGSPWLAAFPPAGNQQMGILLGLGFCLLCFVFCQTPENSAVSGGLLLTPNELGFLRSVVRVPPPSLWSLLGDSTGAFPGPRRKRGRTSSSDGAVRSSPSGGCCGAGSGARADVAAARGRPRAGGGAAGERAGGGGGGDGRTGGRAEGGRARAPPGEWGRCDHLGAEPGLRGGRRAPA